MLLKGAETQREGQLSLLALGPLCRGPTARAETPDGLRLVRAGQRDQALRQRPVKVLARRIPSRTDRHLPVALLQRQLEPLAPVRHHLLLLLLLWVLQI